MSNCTICRQSQKLRLVTRSKGAGHVPVPKGPWSQLFVRPQTMVVCNLLKTKTNTDVFCHTDFKYCNSCLIMSEGVEVKVYIYDLSRGLARSMSQAFLGNFVLSNSKMSYVFEAWLSQSDIYAFVIFLLFSTCCGLKMLCLYLLCQNCLHLTFYPYLSSETYPHKYEKLPNIFIHSWTIIIQYNRKNEFVENVWPANSALFIYVSIHCVETVK